MALVAVLRGPGFVWEVLNIDESDFFLNGQSLVEGGDAYVSFGANTWARGLLKRNFPSQDPTAIEIAEWIRHHTYKDEKIYVCGYFNPVYILADRRPASRFVNPSPVVGDFDPLHVPPAFDASPFIVQRDAEMLVRDLTDAPCAWFVDTAPSNLHGWSHFPLALVPVLEAHVRSSYVLAAEVANARIYQRLTADAAPAAPGTSRHGG